MLDNIFGLPLHPLVVHATVVVVPTAALAVLVSAVWPRFRAWAGWGPLLLAAAAVVLVPISTGSGESLEHRLPETALIEKHADLAEGLLPWVIALAVAAAAVAWVSRRPQNVARFLPVAATVLALVAAAGTVVQVARIGHSGAKASWSDVPAQAQGAGDADDD